MNYEREELIYWKEKFSDLTCSDILRRGSSGSLSLFAEVIIANKAIVSPISQFECKRSLLENLDTVSIFNQPISNFENTYLMRIAHWAISLGIDTNSLPTINFRDEVKVENLLILRESDVSKNHISNKALINKENQIQVEGKIYNLTPDQAKLLALFIELNLQNEANAKGISDLIKILRKNYPDNNFNRFDNNIGKFFDEGEDATSEVLRNKLFTTVKKKWFLKMEKLQLL